MIQRGIGADGTRTRQLVVEAPGTLQLFRQSWTLCVCRIGRPGTRVSVVSGVLDSLERVLQRRLD